MGINLECKGKIFHDSYSSWNAFRRNIANLMLIYLEDTKCSSPDTLEMIEELKKINYGQDYGFISMLNFYSLVKIVNILKKYINELKNHKMYGILLLLDKSDCEGEYSVEECENILQSFEILEYLCKKDKFAFYSVFNLLKISINTKQPIKIC
jgi:hypothetical protein